MNMQRRFVIFAFLLSTICVKGQFFLTPDTGTIYLDDLGDTKFFDACNYFLSQQKEGDSVQYMDDDSFSYFLKVTTLVKGPYVKYKCFYLDDSLNSVRGKLIQKYLSTNKPFDTIIKHANVNSASTGVLSPPGKLLTRKWSAFHGPGSNIIRIDSLNYCYDTKFPGSSLSMFIHIYEKNEDGTVAIKYHSYKTQKYNTSALIIKQNNDLTISLKEHLWGINFFEDSSKKYYKLSNRLFSQEGQSWQVGKLRKVSVEKYHPGDSILIAATNSNVCYTTVERVQLDYYTETKNISYYLQPGDGVKEAYLLKNKASDVFAQIVKDTSLFEGYIDSTQFKIHLIYKGFTSEFIKEVGAKVRMLGKDEIAFIETESGYFIVKAYADPLHSIAYILGDLRCYSKLGSKKN